jgi:hypothetical protein
MISRQVVAVAVVGILWLSGCAQAAPAVTSAPTSTPTSTPTATPESSGRPLSNFDLGCSDLVSGALVTQIAGADAVGREPEVIAGFSLERAAVIQDGGIICEWAVPGAPLHAPGIQVSALAGTSGDIQRIRPMLEASPHFYQTEGGDGSTIMVGCREDFQNPGTAQCHWLAEQGDGLMEAFFPVVPTAENMLDGTPSAELVRSALATLEASPRRDRAAPAVARSCDQILPPGTLVTSVGTFFAVPRDRSLEGMLGVGTTGWMTIALWSVAQERLGWTSCEVNLGSAESPETIDLAHVLDARGAGWIGEYAELAPFGPFPAAAASCGADEGGEYCYVTAIRGDSVIRYTSRDSRTEIAEAVLTATTEE